WYRQAMEQTTDVRPIAVLLAATLLEEGRAGKPESLAEAESWYRACTSPDDPNRSEALNGLAVCLILRGENRRDASLFQKALDHLDECLRDLDADAKSDSGLAHRARENQACARLHLVQTRMTRDEPQPAGDDPSLPRKSEKSGKPEVSTDPEKGSDPGDRGQAMDPNRDRPTSDASEKNRDRERPGAGSGDREMILGSPDGSTLTPETVREQVREASRRINEESRRHLRGKSRTVTPGVRDW
ncbi:MAG: tetratricopeptide repeat protein, partial [Gemmataceae bacterium]